MSKALVLLCLLVSLVEAAPEDDYQAASKLAGDRATIPQAIAAFERLGAERPVSRWTDNAWSEAGRLAERLGELERARAAYEQVVAITDDPKLRSRAKGGLERLGGAAWDGVKREHMKWIAESLRGDPQAALGELEQLARANPAYPDRANIWLAVARGWELEGQGERALELLREPFDHASGGDRARLGFAFVRIATRRGFVDDADAVLAKLAAEGADQGVVAKLRDRVDTAARRAWIRRGMWIAVLVFAALAAAMLRRETGAWRAAGSAMLRPPSEVVYMLPIAAVMIGVAYTGNPIVARALLAILAAGLVISWISGALFQASKARRGRISTARALGQAVLVIAAISCVAYLAIDRDRLLDLVEETVEHGPANR